MTSSINGISVVRKLEIEGRYGALSFLPLVGGWFTKDIRVDKIEGGWSPEAIEVVLDGSNYDGFAIEKPGGGSFLIWSDELWVDGGFPEKGDFVDYKGIVGKVVVVNDEYNEEMQCVGIIGGGGVVGGFIGGFAEFIGGGLVLGGLAGGAINKVTEFCAEDDISIGQIIE